jgi:nitrite reductase/ring-hydroxylating ferredoxin subunit
MAACSASQRALVRLSGPSIPCKTHLPASTIKGVRLPVQIKRSRLTQRSPPALAHAIAAPEAPATASQPETSVSAAALDWSDNWWPVAFLSDVTADTYAATLLGERIVLWKDASGALRCFRDACPHRLVPLSEGRVSPATGLLECPYHGWQFESDGTCASMPQGGDPASPRACATAYRCAVRQGLVWVKLKPAATAADKEADAIPVLPELGEDGRGTDGWFAFGEMWRDLPYDYATLIENVIDAGHVPFTHHASVSKRQSSGNFDDMRVTERGEWGFKGVWPTGPRKGTLGAQHTLFSAPQLMRHTIDALDSKGFANITAVYGAPTAPGRCRAFVRQPFKFKSPLPPLLFSVLPKFLGHLGNNDVLDDDVGLSSINVCISFCYPSLFRVE